MAHHPTSPRIRGVAVVAAIAPLVVLAPVSTAAVATVPVAAGLEAPRTGAHPGGANAAELKVERRLRLVSPGSTAQRITAYPGRNARGTVTFVLHAKDLRLVDRVRVDDDGEAVYRPRPLGTGGYRVVVRYGERRGEVRFRVRHSRLALRRTTFTIPAKLTHRDRDQLTGRVLRAAGARRGDRGVEGGYVDVYRFGDARRGKDAPSLLGFGGVRLDGTFEYDDFGQRLHSHFRPGRYTFLAVYTPSPSYADYRVSNVITVVVRKPR